ncbi:protein dpy-30 homolog [Hyalella azteca]|uniref:Protein dpy-30 homolog n=1 Tax=Hyalella azteca TaxID=294128 RepID=A0A8B7NA03_HYAAZ|nr:protein dpy-30 homolog [Hyalella azteca]
MEVNKSSAENDSNGTSRDSSNSKSDNCNGSKTETSNNKMDSSNSSCKTGNSNGSTQPRKRSRLDLSSLTSRQYLDQTVVPVLLQALTKLNKERPSDPIDFIANYLRNHSENICEGNSSATA